MPLPSFELHKILDAAVQLAEKAAEMGVAAHLAIKAFHDRLYPEPHEGEGFKSSGAYEQLPPEMQAAVDEQVAGVGQS